MATSQVQPDSLVTFTDTVDVDKPRFQQQPGLALAASKIFFSEKRWSIGGFGEFNYVPLQQNVSSDLGDLELYYSGLYRYATFFGYRLTDKLIWNSEFQLEFLHDREGNTHHEIVVEAFVDYLFADYLKGRLGFYPLTIGYVNNNDEPVMFYSVNRSEVERLITPSTWIEFGAMFYGNISKDWSYALGFSQGLSSQNFLGASWIRQGREIRLDVPRSIAVNPQINYHGVNNLTLSASGYYGNSGQGETVRVNDREEEIKGRINLTTAYAKYDWRTFRFVAVGTYGTLGDTEKIFQQTADTNEAGQVLGSNTFGYLFEMGNDILPYLRGRAHGARPHRSSFLFDSHEMKLSLFARYERLNTHHQVNPLLVDLPRVESNLHITTLGVNFNTKENIVLKANYQYRKNMSPSDPRPTSNIIETGLGFIF
ncbi:hypothetical protein M8998_11055 [Sphingobacterium sp. lm-10]|uniref:hypothetical protein n=1 Tax=Sphingobacterium sp. lm-10 TaxID=2944904 RepID=UPI0020226B52|nr:hypothetical protein [Sphingobacterium sp. lm-10]MCL7988478.1 hypothetical protein [Sphingobacterium sp. lm-10]